MAIAWMAPVLRVRQAIAANGRTKPLQSRRDTAAKSGTKVLVKHVVSVLLVAVPALLTAEPTLAQGANLSFELASNENPGRPKDWKFHGAENEFALDSMAYDGQRSLRLIRSRAGGSTGASQTVPAAALPGTRIRLSGYLRTRDATGGAAGLALIVWGSAERMLYVESMTGTGATGTQEWTRYEIELPLPRDAVRIDFGAHFSGAGTAWVDALVLEVMADTTIADSASAYLEHALDLMQTHSIRRDSIDWRSFRAHAREQVRGTKAVSALHPVLEVLVRRLGDGHSLFVRPGPARQSARLSPIGERVSERVGYLRVPGFGNADQKQSTAYADTVQDKIRALDVAGVCGWIVDLRNNTGGNMWPMIAGLGPLLGARTVGWFIYPNGLRESWQYLAGASLLKDQPLARVSGQEYRLHKADPPVAVLTDGRTASSGEAVAVAFRGRARTRSFGAATAGMSTGNQSFDLPDGARLVLTVAVFADRTGHVYGGVIKPDVALDNSTGSPPPVDAVVQAAKTWIEAQPECARPSTDQPRR